MSAYKPLVNSILRISAYAWAQGQIGINSWHAKVSAVTTGGATLTEIAEAVDAQVQPKLRDLLASNAMYLGIKVATIGVAPVPIPGIAEDTQDGTAGVGLLPTQTAGLLTFLTEFAGPAGRGRVYIPFPSSADSEADDLPSDDYGARALLYGGLFDTPWTIVGVGGQTDFDAGLWDPTLGTFRPFTAQRFNKRWATQKRRGQYGRQNPAAIT